MITPAANPFLMFLQVAAVVSLIGALWAACVLPVVEYSNRREQKRRAHQRGH